MVEAGDVLTADGLLFRGDDVRYADWGRAGYMQKVFGTLSVSPVGGSVSPRKRTRRLGRD